MTNQAGTPSASSEIYACGKAKIEKNKTPSKKPINEGGGDLSAKSSA
jgi:hypothetical protein